MFDLIIIGAGVSGLMAGIKSNVNTLILEKNNEAGKKLLISGNSRCNLTNNKSNDQFLLNIEVNRKHLYSTINNFGPKEIMDFFIKNDVLLKEETDNKIFPLNNKSESILKVLLKNCKHTINYNEEVIDINKKDNYFEIVTNKNKYLTKKLIIATGGSSYKHTGSTGDNIKFAKKLGQPIVDIYPVEVPIILTNKADLAGTSIDNVLVKCNKIKKSGTFLFTHKGISGSAVMAISEYVYKQNAKEIEVDFLIDYNNDEFLNIINNYDKEKEIHTFLETIFTKKLSLYFLNNINMNKSLKIKQLNNRDKINLIREIKEKRYEIKKVEDINYAYVTGGGIDMKYINSKTMESTIIKNLYFTGEALDTHGPIGGYNITLALSTGYTAGYSSNN